MVRKAGKHQRLAARMLKYLSRDTRRCTAVLYQRSDNSQASFPRLGIPELFRKIWPKVTRIAILTSI